MLPSGRPNLDLTNLTRTATPQHTCAQRVSGMALDTKVRSVTLGVSPAFSCGF